MDRGRFEGKEAHSVFGKEYDEEQEYDNAVGNFFSKCVW